MRQHHRLGRIRRGRVVDNDHEAEFGRRVIGNRTKAGVDELWRLIVDDDDVQTAGR